MNSLNYRIPDRAKALLECFFNTPSISFYERRNEGIVFEYITNGSLAEIYDAIINMGKITRKVCQHVNGDIKDIGVQYFDWKSYKWITDGYIHLYKPDGTLQSTFRYKDAELEYFIHFGQKESYEIFYGKYIIAKFTINGIPAMIRSSNDHHHLILYYKNHIIVFMSDRAPIFNHPAVCMDLHPKKYFQPQIPFQFTYWSRVCVVYEMGKRIPPRAIAAPNCTSLTPEILEKIIKSEPNCGFYIRRKLRFNHTYVDLDKGYKCVCVIKYNTGSAVVYEKTYERESPLLIMPADVITVKLKFSKKGKLLSLRSFKNGQNFGHWIEYDQNGNLIEDKVWVIVHDVYKEIYFNNDFNF